MEEAQGCQTTNGNCHGGDRKFKENMALSPPRAGSEGDPSASRGCTQRQGNKNKNIGQNLEK